MLFNKTHRSPYAILSSSPWPTLMGLNSLCVVGSLIAMFQWNFYTPITLSLLGVCSIMYFWCRDVSREGVTYGNHSSHLQTCMRYAFMLFIASEVLFFASFFWTYFNSMTAITDDASTVWPPEGSAGINPAAAPFLNTMILLMSGSVATWVHGALPSRCRTGSSLAFISVIFLGLWFAYIQSTEYTQATVSFNDAIYGGTFFIATGFHGLHVMIGATFLLMMFFRGRMNNFTNDHHFGFEAAAWYWHFVDVVWLFLFFSVYLLAA